MNRILLFVAAAMLLVSCNPLKQIETTYNNAESSYGNKSYQEAYDNYSGLISMYKSKSMDVPNAIYLKAADCAAQLQNTGNAKAMFQSAMKDSLTLTALKGYVNTLKQEQNYSDVVKVLESNSAFINENGETTYLKQEQFNAAVALNNTEDILKTYGDVSPLNEEQSMAVINAFVTSDNNKSALKFANKTVKDNPKFYEVKEWKGIYNYTIAEKWYKSEMDKYNKNKNYTAYVYLKRELKKISSSYRVSKSIFEELHKLNPEQTKYIKYLKNIYLRLDLKKDAEAMDKLLK